MNNRKHIGAMASAWPLTTVRRVTTLLGMYAVTVAMAQTQFPAPEIYICVDAQGRRLTSDRKIPECVDREQKILNPSGTVKAIVPPLLTTKEQQALEEKAWAEQEARIRPLKEKKRLQALLIRYPNQTVHEKERAQALAQATAIHLTDPTAKEVALTRINSRFDDEQTLLKPLWDHNAEANANTTKP